MKKAFMGRLKPRLKRSFVSITDIIFLNINPFGDIWLSFLSYLICTDELDRADQIAHQLLANNWVYLDNGTASFLTLKSGNW